MPLFKFIKSLVAGIVSAMVFAVVMLMGLLLLTQDSASANSLYQNIRVSDIGNANTIIEPNINRSVATSLNGNIYVAYSGGAGIRVARSTNRGQAFQSSVQITTTNSNVETTVDNTGIVYVAFVGGPLSNQLFLSRSTDEAVTFSTPMLVSLTSCTGTTGARVVTYGSNVYMTARCDKAVYVNNNRGVGSFQIINFDTTGRTDTDLQIDKSNGDVYVVTSDPAVRIFKSTNNGFSFNPLINPPNSSQVYFSTSTLVVSGTQKFMFVSGGNNNTQFTQTLRINLATSAVVTQSSGYNTYDYGRSLATNACGSLVNGFTTQNLGVGYQISNDLGATYNATTEVATGALRQSIAISEYYNDIIAVYEKNGQVFASIYQNELPGCPDIALSKTASSATPALGSNVTYTLSAVNLGGGIATGVVISDALPSALSFVSVSTPTLGTATYFTNSRTVVWNIPQLNIGMTTTLSIVARVTASGMITNSIVGTLNETDPNPGNNGGSIGGLGGGGGSVITVSCPAAPSVVLNTDNGAGTDCGTLSYAILQTSPGTPIRFDLFNSNVLTVTGQLPTVTAGKIIDGGTCTNGVPGITITGESTTANVDGLRISGATLRNITVTKFGGIQIKTVGRDNDLKCVIARNR